jgi:hypothetical protein
MKEKSNGDESKSLIGSIVSPHRLKEERQMCMEKASGSYSWEKRNKDAKSVHHTGKSSYEKIPFTFTKEQVFNRSNPFTSKKEKTLGKKGNSQKRSFSEMAKDRIIYALRSKGKMNRPAEPDADDLDRVLVAKKKKASNKRSKRGAIIPKERPDLDAKRAQSQSEKILTRARKKRKNKKKQKRDEVLTEFAMDNT